MKEYHKCKRLEEQTQLAYGSDFSIYYTNENGWVISTDEEYETEIVFCPFCGIELKNPEPKKEAK